MVDRYDPYNSYDSSFDKLEWIDIWDATDYIGLNVGLVRICNPTTQLRSRVEPDVSICCPSVCFPLFPAGFRIASGLISLVLYITLFYLLHFCSPVN